jgi:D-alanine-D-alanine ligase
VSDLGSKTRILLVFGGESSEHDVSVVSARNVHGALDATAYQVSLAYIDRVGRWYLVDSVDDTQGTEILPVLGEKKFSTKEGEEIVIDVMLPILHGQHGEDGTVQGMAKLLHVSCVGPSTIGAAMTMDKDITKRLLRDGGVPVVDWLVWYTHDDALSYEQAMRRLGSDVLFIKPANAGSSVGVSKVSDASGFAAALKVAAKHDSIVLIEPAVAAREIEVAVLGTERPQASTPGEIVPGADFYSYDDKYAADSRATARIPAALDGTLAKQIQAYALQAYRLTRGQGMARVDFFVTSDNTVYLNEINAIPGFTNISMYPKLWEYDGVGCSELIDRLISDAIDNYHG